MESEDGHAEFDLRLDTTGEAALGAFAHISAAIPVIGGIASSLAASASTDSKIRRLIEAIQTLDDEAAEFEKFVNAEYVRSEEFEELAEKVLTAIRETRSIDRGRLLLSLLENDTIRGFDIPYDDKIRFIRLIDELDPHAILLLDAISRPTPGKPDAGGFGSFKQSLAKKLSPDYQGDTDELLRVLQREGLIQEGVSWGAMGTAQGMHETAHAMPVTGTGFISFIKSPAITE